ncbi:hypothetical protein SKAU_G00209950 [Synaphobranchus kaupii]|uniref:DUF4371 domain-containing protein n=1 Tax=Synaphobranchus kaupii TaxID=118154 RepID=A0A9Q1F951_SYNKA|nr:hypothetical protein SKAU_G00209950 [Synaphobranchus kaupii]
MQDALAEVLNEDISQKIKDAQFVMVLADESTDVATSRKLCIYLRIVTGIMAETLFLRNLQIASGNAETEYAAIKELLHEKAVDQQDDPKGKGILKNIATYEFMGVMAMLMDVIPVLTQLSLVFQKKDLAVVNPALETAKDQLKHLITNNGAHSVKFRGEAGDSMKEYIGVSVTDSATQRRKVTTVKVDLINNMLEQLEKRFPKEATDIVSMFSVLALHHIPEGELEGYGNDKVDFLIIRYGSSIGPHKPLISAQETKAECLCLKRLVVAEKYPCGKIGRLYKIISQHHGESFPNPNGWDCPCTACPHCRCGEGL